jgi:hypothetical protein
MVVEKRVSVRWGSHVCETRLMMKTKMRHIYSTFILHFPAGTDKEASAHMLRAGVGEKGPFS